MLDVNGDRCVLAAHSLSLQSARAAWPVGQLHPGVAAKHLWAQTNSKGLSRNGPAQRRSLRATAAVALRQPLSSCVDAGCQQQRHAHKCADMATYHTTQQSMLHTPMLKTSLQTHDALGSLISQVVCAWTGSSTWGSSQARRTSWGWRWIWRCAQALPQCVAHGRHQ